MLEAFHHLASQGATLQREAIADTHPAILHRHITDTLRRCFPASAVIAELTEGCFLAVQPLSQDTDPLHTGAILAYAGQYLFSVAPADDPLLQKLHRSAKKLLPPDSPATRDDLRLVALDALYHPGVLPDGVHNAYIRHRLGLNDHRLSNEEIAARMHMPLVAIHELEAAILTALSYHYDGGSHA